MDERRHARRFEPPPWEAEQFAELEQTRDVEPDDGDAPLQPGDGEAAIARQAESLPTEGAKLDDARVAEMLEALAAEEPQAANDLWKWGNIAAVALGATGVAMVVWGAVALVKAGSDAQMARLGGLALVGVGGVFAGAGVWVVYGNLRKRGVI